MRKAVLTVEITQPEWMCCKQKKRKNKNKKKIAVYALQRLDGVRQVSEHRLAVREEEDVAVPRYVFGQEGYCRC